MKKNMGIVLFLLFIAVGARGAVITVTQPAGGSVTMGGACPIAWTASNVTANVKILLVKPGGALVGVLAGNLAAGGSPWNWTVGFPTVVGQQYQIRVRAVDGSAVGESAVFVVVQGTDPAPGSITNVQLSGSNPFCLGSSYTIGWTVSNVSQPLKLELIKYDSPLGVIVNNLPPGTSTFGWTAGNYNGGPAGADMGFKLRVAAVDGSLSALSAAFELKNCGGGAGSGMKPGNTRNPKEISPIYRNDLDDPAQKLWVNLHPITLPGIYRNHPCSECFPAAFSPPPLGPVMQAWLACGCGYAGGSVAQVGAYWFSYENFQLAANYRSQVCFSLDRLMGKGAQLLSAKLKMKRVQSIHEDANSSCGCSENLFALMAPMTSCAIPDMGPAINIPLGEAEFSRDITAIVRNWLDGTWANHGLLLLAGESPCSGGRKCYSCYEASLVLTMK